LDCVQTECFRSNGMLANPGAWTFAVPGPPVAGKVREPWIASSIVLSLEMPWEIERKTRLWQLVWSGLFRAVQTPPWELPRNPPSLATNKEATRNILQGWLPPLEGPGSTMTGADMAALLEAS